MTTAPIEDPTPSSDAGEAKRGDPATPSYARASRGLEPVAPAVLAGGLVLGLSFASGGFTAGSTAKAAIAVALALAGRALFARTPVAGLGVAAAVPIAALGLFACWTLASSLWSDAPARALLEFDRTLLYLLVLVLFAGLGRTPSRVRWLVRGLVAAFAGVAAAALVSRLFPEVLAVELNGVNGRLSYPVSYWNALGLIAALAAVLLLHLSSSRGEPRVVRVLAAAAIPVVTATLLLTFSRAALGVAVLGLLAYPVLARPRLLPSAILAAGPAAAYTVMAALAAEALTGGDPLGPLAQAEGRDLALAVAVAAVGAAVLRAALLVLDVRLLRLDLGPLRGRLASVTGVLIALVVVVGLAAVVDARGLVERAYTGFVEGNSISDDAGERERLSQVGNNGRIDHWGVALRAFRSEPLHGAGAGTYQLLWARDRPSDFVVVDGHSLYLEVLGELGWVGLVLLLTALGALVLALALRLRESRARGPYAALLVAVGMWAVHAGVDWLWEVPAVTVWIFAAGGLAASLRARSDGPGAEARPSPSAARARSGWLLRMGLVAGVAVLALTPALIARSQDELDRSVAALRADDCPTAIDAALNAAAAVPPRPEPWEVIGYCDVRIGAPRLAVAAFNRAVERDPRNWELRYGLALVRGAAGQDPRPALREVLRLNPREPLARAASARLGGDDPRGWRRGALSAPLPLP